MGEDPSAAADTKVDAILFDWVQSPMVFGVFVLALAGLALLVVYIVEGMRLGPPRPTRPDDGRQGTSGRP